MIRPLALFPALLALLPLAGPVAAASPVSLEVAVVSDYRWRGLSLTDRRPTPQATLTANGPRGSYAFLWGSRIANSGPDIEVQLGGGIAREVAGTTLDLSAAYSLYPGVKGSNLFELTGTASRPLGPIELGLTLVYAPVQRSTGGKRNLYTEVSGRVPVAKGLAVRGTLGREHGAFASDRRNRNWSAGAEGELAGMTLAADWVGSSHSGAGRLGGDALVLSVSRGF